MSDAESFIPGTTTPRPLPPPPPEPEWKTNKRLSKEWRIPDADGNYHLTRLYTVGALASALGLEAVTIRAWITKRYIPDAGMRTPKIASHLMPVGRRLWTAAQIETIVRVATEEEIALVRWPHKIRSTHFVHRIWSIWTQNDW